MPLLEEFHCTYFPIENMFAVVFGVVFETTPGAVFVLFSECKRFNCYSKVDREKYSCLLRKCTNALQNCFKCECVECLLSLTWQP